MVQNLIDILMLSVKLFSVKILCMCARMLCNNIFNVK